MDPLLQPFQIKHLTLRNRIISTAHAPSYQEDGHPKERYKRYHEEKAKGGVGLTMIGGSTNIAPDSPSVFGQLYAGDDSVIPWFKELTEAVHAHGAAIMCQITHMGRRTAWDDGNWLPVIGPSQIRERAHRAIPKVMEQEDINRVISNFADAAVRCKKGGFDGIELLSHSHLLGQFLSPLTNQREDEYGGSLENRLRLIFEVLETVRGAVGPDFIIGMRITGDELTEGGLTGEECVAAAQKIAATGHVDFFNILAGAPYDDLGLAGWVSPMGMPSAPHLGIADQIRKAVDIPIFHAGGVADIATARNAIKEGNVDLIGMTRAHMADPYLVSKLSSGHEERIRPCVGLGYCVDRVNQGKAAVCGHNATTGRETHLPHVIEKSSSQKKVVIVGGGAGGMEAARVSAERGHDVILFEASDRLGGQLNLACKGTTRRQVQGVTDWLIQELEYLNISIRLNHYAETQDILAEKPDIVIVATGGWPDQIDIPGQALTLSSWDVLSGESRLSGDVLLYDEIGDQAAGVCADFLADNGCKVTLTTPDRTVLHDLGPTNSAVVLKELSNKNVSFDCFYELSSVSTENNRKEVTLRHVLTGETKTHITDHVVVEHGSSPMDALYFEMKANSYNLGQINHDNMVSGQGPIFQDLNSNGDYYLARIGDAVTSRNFHAAIYDALRICKNL